MKDPLYDLQEQYGSVLKDGIETISILLDKPYQIMRLTFALEKSRDSVLNYLMFGIGRHSEVDRVIGMSVVQGAPIAAPGLNPSAYRAIIVTLELAQPGKQLEEWLTPFVHWALHWTDNDGIIVWNVDRDEKLGELNARSITGRPHGNNPTTRSPSDRHSSEVPPVGG